MDTLKQENKSNEKEEVKIAKLKVHEAKIVEDLFTSNGLQAPRVLYGKKAEAFLKEEAIEGQEFLDKKRSGCFIRDFKEESTVSEKDRRTGVVCMFKIRIATLAHELRHSYQWQTDKSLFANTKEEKELYEANSRKFNKKDYYNTPAEKDAFTYAMQYLNTHSGLFSGFFKRWEYRLDILALKNIILTCVMFVMIFIALFKLRTVLLSNSMSLVVIAMVMVIVAWLLFHGACRVLMDKEQFRRLK